MEPCPHHVLDNGFCHPCHPPTRNRFYSVLDVVVTADIVVVERSRVSLGQDLLRLLVILAGNEVDELHAIDY